MKRITHRCPFYSSIEDCCTHPEIDLKPGCKVCDGNCYEEIDK